MSPRRRERVARAGRLAEGGRLVVVVQGHEPAVRLRPSARALAARMRPRGWLAPSSPGSALTAPEAGDMVRPMTGRKLSIGIQTFRTIREEGCYYVDKTAYACRPVDEGTHYFLSRPRRFGKSLFVDTLKELFEGNEPLFEGLDVHERWDWSVRHPVVRPASLPAARVQGALVRDRHAEVPHRHAAAPRRRLPGAGREERNVAAFAVARARASPPPPHRRPIEPRSRRRRSVNLAASPHVRPSRSRGSVRSIDFTITRRSTPDIARRNRISREQCNPSTSRTRTTNRETTIRYRPNPRHRSST